MPPSHPPVPVLGVDIGGSGSKGAPVDLAAGERVAGPVGLTLPAVVTSGTVRTAANIDPGWIGVDAGKLFGKATGRPVAVVNDADAAGLAEIRYGAGAGRQGVVVVATLGTGIGTAVF